MNDNHVKPVLGNVQKAGLDSLPPRSPGLPAVHRADRTSVHIEKTAEETWREDCVLLTKPQPLLTTMQPPRRNYHDEFLFGVPPLPNV